MDTLVLAHAGAGSLPEHTDATEAACDVSLRRLRAGDGPLDAAVAGCMLLEDDPRTNAGTGSTIRLDGNTVEMDASCMDSNGRYGAVANLRSVRHPVLVARQVLETPHLLLAGHGALAFARRMGHAEHDATTESRRRVAEVALHSLREGVGDGGWTLADLQRYWNYASPPPQSAARMEGRLESHTEPGVHDTVGVIVRQGDAFAAASSSGGTQATLLGRVGDVPLFGAGIYAGPAGAVAVTGDGEHLSQKLLSYRVYQMLEQGIAPARAVKDALGWFEPSVDVGILAVGMAGAAGGSNRRMAWSLREAHA